MYPLLSIANLIIENHQKKMIPAFTATKIQKLLFLSEAWSYKIFGNALTDDFFSVWSTGPVNPSLYHKLKYYKENTVQNFVSLSTLRNEEYVIYHMIVPEKDQETRDLIKKIVDVYGELRPSQLIYLTKKFIEPLSLKEGEVFERNHFEQIDLTNCS